MSMKCPECEQSFSRMKPLHWHLRIDHGLEREDAFHAANMAMHEMTERNQYEAWQAGEGRAPF
ncbi:hypothetical protein K2D_12840 [Planctomycetes bacterium K2D]|nr:hypothetical protein K2D_12840 [Planctomycetes bacterium K2D]